MTKILILSLLFALTSCFRNSNICEIDNVDRNITREIFIHKYEKPKSSSTINPNTTKLYEYRYPLSFLKGKVNNVKEDIWTCNDKSIYLWFQFIDGEYIYYDHLIWKNNYQY